MFRQMWSVYAKANRRIRMFSYCNVDDDDVDVKLTKVKSYCTSFYRPFFCGLKPKSTFESHLIMLSLTLSLCRGLKRG